MLDGLFEEWLVQPAALAARKAALNKNLPTLASQLSDGRVVRLTLFGWLSKAPRRSAIARSRSRWRADSGVPWQACRGRACSSVPAPWRRPWLPMWLRCFAGHENGAPSPRLPCTLQPSSRPGDRCPASPPSRTSVGPWSTTTTSRRPRRRRGPGDGSAPRGMAHGGGSGPVRITLRA